MSFYLPTCTHPAEKRMNPIPSPPKLSNQHKPTTLKVYIDTLNVTYDFIIYIPTQNLQHQRDRLLRTNH